MFMKKAQSFSKDWNFTSKGMSLEERRLLAYVVALLCWCRASLEGLAYGDMSGPTRNRIWAPS